MQRRTAEKVADTLGMVESWLTEGRPRKRPSQYTRPEAEIAMTKRPVRVTPTTYYEGGLFGKVSLVGAFKASIIGEGYSPTVRRYAEEAFIAAAARDGWKPGVHGILDIDTYEPDTRQLIRYARAARRHIEASYGL